MIYTQAKKPDFNWTDKAASDFINWRLRVLQREPRDASGSIDDLRSADVVHRLNVMICQLDFETEMYDDRARMFRFRASDIEEANLTKGIGDYYNAVMRREMFCVRAELESYLAEESFILLSRLLSACDHLGIPVKTDIATKSALPNFTPPES